MRTLSDALLAKQKVGIGLKPRVKCALTHASLDPYTYYSNDRVLKVEDHVEDYWDQHATVVLNNHDTGLNAIDLRGYQMVLSYGYYTTEYEYSDCAPLWILPETYRSSKNERLKVTLRAVGIPNLLARDRASESYVPRFTIAADEPTDPAPVSGDYWQDSDDSTWYTYNGAAWVAGDPPTVKTLLSAVLGATLAPFDHCHAWTVAYDSEDSLIDSFMPKDDFRVYAGMSRLACAKKLLTKYTGCMMRAKADGQIHVWVPTVTGASYDYEYKATEASYHHFEAKDTTQSIVTPNKVTVSTYSGVTPAYSGSAEQTGYSSLPSQVKNTRFYKTALESDLQAATIATAIQSRFVYLYATTGGAFVREMNVGQECGDYVKVWDSRDDKDVTHNIGRLIRNFSTKQESGQDRFDLSFEFGYWSDAETIEENLQAGSDALTGLSDRSLLIDSLDAYWIDPDGTTDLDKISDGPTYARVKSLHLDAGQLVLDENIQYSTGYNPTTKFDLGTNDIDDIPEFEGSTYSRTKRSALTAEGLVVFDMLSVSATDGGLPFSKTAAASVFLSAWGLSGGTLSGAITAVADAGGGEVTISVTSHGMVTGDYVHIIETTSYNGLYPITKVNDNSFKVTHDFTSTQTGYAFKVQAFMNSDDGKMYAGGGKVILDNSGVTIHGQYLTFHETGGAGNATGYIYLADGTDLASEQDALGDLLLFPPTGYVWIMGSVPSIVPDKDNSGYCGTSSYRWLECRAVTFYGALSGNASTATYATSAGSASTATYATSAGTAGYATSAGNADTVDSYHASSFLLLSGGTMAGGIHMSSYTLTTSQIDSYGFSAIGSAGTKFGSGYFLSLPTCKSGAPTSLSAIDVIKQIKKPKLKDGDQGSRYYFDDEDFPSEMKWHQIENMETEDGILVPVDMDHEEIDYIRTLGVNTQAIFELIEEVELLRQKVAELEARKN